MEGERGSPPPSRAHLIQLWFQIPRKASRALSTSEERRNVIDDSFRATGASRSLGQQSGWLLGGNVGLRRRAVGAGKVLKPRWFWAILVVMFQRLRRILGLDRAATVPASEKRRDVAVDDSDDDDDGEPDFYKEGSPFDGAGPSPFEEDLARELEPLLSHGWMPTPGCDGTIQIELPHGGSAAAVLRYGRLLGRRQSAESFLLLQDPATPRQRVLLGVTEGNYKDPITGLAGVITLSTLAQHVCGTLGTDDLESDLYRGFAKSLQRLCDIVKMKQGPYFSRWRFNRFFWHGPAPLNCPASSVTALALSGTSAVIGHIGEGRAYLLRRGVLRRLSADHTLAALSKDHPPEFGDLPAKVLSGTECQISDVQFARLDLEPLDTIVLGSANLFEEDTAAEGVRKLLEMKTPADACQAFLRLPKPRADRARSITAIVVRLGNVL